MAYAKLYQPEGFELLVRELTNGKKIIYDDGGYEAELKIDSFDYFYDTDKNKKVCQFWACDEDGNSYVIDGEEYMKTWHFIDD